jgi:hypothetical protein
MKPHTVVTVVLVIAALVCISNVAPVSAQQPPAAAGRGGGGFSQPAPADWNEHEGWTQIFDGQTLNNWNCDPNIWSVADGAITAKSTAEKPTGTTYCSWMGGEPADFDLRLEFRMLVGGNSGIQYRSVPQPARGGAARGPGGAAGAARGAAGAPAAAAAPAAPPPVTTALQNAQPCQMQIPVMYPVQAGRGGGGGAARGAAGAPGAAGAAAAGRGGAGGPGAGGPGRGPSPYDVGGYQYDFDYTGNYPGNLYENGMATGAAADASNRGIITYKGQVVHLLPGGRRETIGCTSDGTDLRGVMNINGWNYINVIARGPVLIHMLNGRVMTLTIDDDPVRNKKSGRIAVQIEGLGEVYFRNIWLKNW